MAAEAILSKRRACSYIGLGMESALLVWAPAMPSSMCCSADLVTTLNKYKVGSASNPCCIGVEPHGARHHRETIITIKKRRCE
jgi:hypothetical protein